MRLVIASPSPVPPKRRVIEVSACSKARNRALFLSAAMPMPVSSTSTRAISVDGSKRAWIRTWPRSVNLIALPSRFTTAWRSRVGSE